MRCKIQCETMTIITHHCSLMVLMVPTLALALTLTLTLTLTMTLTMTLTLIIGVDPDLDFDFDLELLLLYFGQSQFTFEDSEHFWTKVNSFSKIVNTSGDQELFIFTIPIKFKMKNQYPKWG